MKVGQTVDIFQDPLTQTELEGKAVLVEKMGLVYGLKGMEVWAVRFPDEERVLVRRIFCPQKSKGRGNGQPA
jgi:hypothetical protein